MAFQISRGSLVIARFRGAPIRVHWTLPIGIVAFTGFRLAPGAWLGFFLVILLHELGHAIAVTRFGQRTVAIDVHGFGGLCWWKGRAQPMQRAIIAWGGVLAQSALLAASLIVLAVAGPPESQFEAQLLSAFIRANLWNMLFNLIPVPPLDGAEAWKIVPLVWKRLRKRAPRKTARPAVIDDEIDDDDLPPLPDDLRRTIDRVMGKKD